MIKGAITGDREVIARFTHMPSNLLDRLTKTITRLCIKLRIMVVQDYLSGQVLNVRNGRLRRSITYDVSHAGMSDVTGTVGTNVAYARFFEKGFHGTENVREHLRLVKKAFGKELRSPVWSTVRAHPRQVDMDAKSFLAPALKGMTPEILDQINAAVKEAH
ncbi:HK97 gp10 family phage protein [Paludibacterium purpuratum]|uniref:Bacteriophage HK97-gp10 putative tail-component n=1 Tax=Paludibacterium purpuratum TaxID=1144873 RepID=A0A4R7BC16_9NEIS|nr:HK97 gp10 family phage protein [Paludibacterium purpuratum]TDR82203.1 bacteriophage HK97-gp10 putative tail-component [Paludibacterium purpuratum]